MPENLGTVAITACPYHQCLLIDHCPNCNRKINWTRPIINICHCEFDFRKSPVILLPKKELRLTTYLYQEFGLFAFSKESLFGSPLKTLARNDLLNYSFLLPLILPKCLIIQEPAFQNIRIMPKFTSIFVRQLKYSTIGRIAIINSSGRGKNRKSNIL